MPDLGPFVGAVAELAGPALRTFLLTTFGMVALGVACAAASIGIAWPAGALRGMAAGAVAMAACCVIGVVLAIKRAVARAVLEGLRRRQLGASALGLIFERLLGVSEATAAGERGGALARTVERLPLADAEKKLRTVVAALLGEAASDDGWLRRRIRANVLLRVEGLTLQRFRAEGAGGVDLVKVRDELGARIDAALAARAESAMRMVTLVLVLLACAGSIGVAFALRH